MANSILHAAVPYPVKKCRFTLLIPYRNDYGNPTDPTTPDTERSIDGAAYADCTEEVTVISGTSTGTGYVTLTGDEMNASAVALAAKAAAGGPKTPLATIYPRVLPIISTGTAQAGAAGTITLAAGAPAYDLSGCIVRTTGGTGGGGGSGSLGNQARVITAYDTETKVATVEPNWETTPDSTTTYDILRTEMASVGSITSNLKKNQALTKFPFTMTDSTNHALTAGLTVTCTRLIDGGTFAAGTLANVTDEGSGLYTVDFAAADLNGNCIVLKASATGADDTIVIIVTQP